MHELWSSASYEPHLLSLPFALAPAAILIVIAYAAVMRGAPILRGFLLGHSCALLPYATVMMLSPSITSPVLAEQLFRAAAAFIPMVGATGTGFQVALLGRYRRHRWAVWSAIASAALWAYLASATNIAVDGVRQLPGFWYAHAGPWAWLALLHTALLTLPGIAALAHVALTSPPSDERRQLRAALLANLVTYAGIIDAPLAFGTGRIPLGWLLSGIGCLLVVRALIVEDLLRVRAVETAAPLLVASFATCALLAWAALDELAAPLPWPLTALALIVCFTGVRVLVATIDLIRRGARGGEGPLDRLLAQLVGRARSQTSPPAIGQLAIDIIELAVGVRARLLYAAQEDWGWVTHTGERLDDTHAPDPLLATWLADHRDPIVAGDLDAVPADLRDLLAKLLAHHAARALVPIGSSDELLGLVLLPVAARVRGPALAFTARAAERLAEALLHARLARRAAERAALAREVELAATVQAELLPGNDPHVHGDITVIGSWQPATRCAGDFWTVTALGAPANTPHPTDTAAHALAHSRQSGDAPAPSNVADARAALSTAIDTRPVLVAIGDVTGHGVASAMVTAAAIGACDVCVRRAGAALDLHELIAALDAAVRRVGGGTLALTCFVAILDPAHREIRFLSCAHPAPYLCRLTEKPPDPQREAATAIELHALVGRGNPLGTGLPASARLQRRSLAPGDLVVWYTDGVVDAHDPAGAAFGDRRLQHLLKKLDRERMTPQAVHDLVQRGVAAHRAGRPRDDDETLVIAQLRPEASR